MSANGNPRHYAQSGSDACRSIHPVVLVKQAEVVTHPGTVQPLSSTRASARIFLRAGLFCLCLVAASILLSVATFAQNDVGTIVGFVTDPQGAVVPNATVIVTNQGTGETRKVTTDAAGRYTVPNVPPATYTVTAEATGFQKFESSQNALASNSTIEIDAKLTVGQGSETIHVSGTADLLQTQSAAVQSEITGQQLQKQELNGRNPIYMTQFLPGVISTATLGDFNFAFNSGDTFNINGARTQDTIYTIDGAPAVRTRDDGEIIAGVNVDSVQEMQVLTADYSAEYGGASGAQVRIVSKSGTTNFHGTAYEYLRNSAMNANTWQRNVNPATHFPQPFVYNNFGFAVGGPVWSPKVPVLHNLRDKFFFFINEDWIRYRISTTQAEPVPTPLMREGNFSELLNPSNPWYSGGKQLYVPGTCPVYGAKTCVPYPNNVIPANQLSPNGMGIITAYPTQTPGLAGQFNNWQGTAPAPQNQRKGQINGDLLFTPNQHLMYRRSDDSYNTLSPFSTIGPLIAEYQTRPNQTNALGWTWTISPTMINEAHFTVSIDDVYNNLESYSPGLNRSQFGIDFPYIIPGPKTAPNKIPTASLPTFSSLAGGPYPSKSSGIIYAGSDSLTKVWGNHAIKAGLFFDYMGENDFDQINVSTVPGGASNQNGTFVFTDTRTGLGGTSGVGLANLALGLADSYTEIGPRAFTVWRGKMFEEFIQDKWQMNPKLNLDYGIRITTIVPPNAQWGNGVYFDPASYNPANAPKVNPTTGFITVGTGNQYNGMVIPGLKQFPSSALVNDRVPAANPANNACAGQPCTGLFDPNLPKGYVATTTQVEPRFGLAYQVFPTTVFRFGGGRFTENKGIIDNIFPGGNSPFQPTLGLTNVLVDNPGASLTPTVAAPLQVTSMARHLQPPNRWNWNITIQQQLPSRISATIAYVGARGNHNWDVFDINQAPAGALIAHPSDNINYLRPYLGFSSIQQAQSGVNELYNALQVGLVKTSSAGSTFGVSYTWSKDMDNGSNYHTIVPDTYYTKNLWGPSEFDVRNALVVNGLYVVPFFANQSTLVGKLAGGWQIAGNAQFQSGLPCSVGSGNDYAGVNEVGSFNCEPPNIPSASVGQFWIQNGPIRRPKKFAGPSGGLGSPQWFSTTTGSGTPLFTAPPAGTFNMQRGIRDNIYAPGLQNWNASLIKSFTVYRETGFEFRAEAYNFPNHPNWSSPNYTATAGTFGEVTEKTTTNPRTLQVGLRYHF